MFRFGISNFTFSPPVLLKKPCTGQVWEMAQPWEVAWKDIFSLRTLTIPAGFQTDLMTCPLKPAGNETIASLLHDGLYVQQPEWCSRDYADEAFLALLLHCGVPSPLGKRYYYAVQALGFIWWERRRRVGTPLATPGEPGEPA